MLISYFPYISVSLCICTLILILNTNRDRRMERQKDNTHPHHTHIWPLHLSLLNCAINFEKQQIAFRLRGTSVNDLLWRRKPLIRTEDLQGLTKELQTLLLSLWIITEVSIHSGYLGAFYCLIARLIPCPRQLEMRFEAFRKMNVWQSEINVI